VPLSQQPGSGVRTDNIHTGFVVLYHKTNPMNTHAHVHYNNVVALTIHGTPILQVLVASDKHTQYFTASKLSTQMCICIYCRQLRQSVCALTTPSVTLVSQSYKIILSPMALTIKHYDINIYIYILQLRASTSISDTGKTLVSVLQQTLDQVIRVHINCD